MSRSLDLSCPNKMAAKSRLGGDREPGGCQADCGKLRKHPSLVKRLNDEPDRLPLGPAAYTKLRMYWEEVMDAWEEEGEA